MVPMLIEAMLPQLGPVMVPLNQQAVMVPSLPVAMPLELPRAEVIVHETEQAVMVPKLPAAIPLDTPPCFTS